MADLKTYRVPLNYDSFFEKPLNPYGSEEGGFPNGLFADGSSAGDEWAFNPLDVSSLPGGSVKTSEQSVTGKTVSITYIIDGGGSAITTGSKGFLEIPFPCKIKRASLLADTGTATVDVWKDKWDNHPPTDDDSITDVTPLTITADAKYEDVNLTDWNRTIRKGDILRFNVDAVSGATFLTVTLETTKEE